MCEQYVIYGKILEMYLLDSLQKTLSFGRWLDILWKHSISS